MIDATGIFFIRRGAPHYAISMPEVKARRREIVKKCGRHAGTDNYEERYLPAVIRRECEDPKNKARCHQCGNRVCAVAINKDIV